MTEPRNDGKENGSKMTNIELQKKANEVRKGIVTSVHSAKAGHDGRFFVCGGYFYLSVF